MIVQQQIEQNQISKELDLKEKEKEEAKKQKIVVENQAKFEKRLNLVLFGIGVLTLLSVWKDFSDLMTNGLSKNELLSFVELLVVVVIMVFIISKVSNFYQKK